MAEPNWEQQVLDRTKLDAVFLTNNFDDPLTGFDTKRYVPCLRTDDLVFHLGKPEVRQRLEKATDTDVHDAKSLRSAIGRLFMTFHGQRRSGLRDFAAADVRTHSSVRIGSNAADLQAVLQTHALERR